MARILIVEDNTDLRDILQHLLSREHEVFGVGRGEDAIELARLHPPDAVILDLQLPSIDGIETGRVLKEELGNEVAILVLTALAENGDPQRVLASGCCDDYMAKPAPLAAIQARVDQLLKDRHAA